MNDYLIYIDFAICSRLVKVSLYVEFSAPQARHINCISWKRQNCMGIKHLESWSNFRRNPIALRTAKTLWGFGCSECIGLM